MEISDIIGELDEGELIKGASDGGEFERKIERWICVEGKAKVGAIDVFADLRTLGALITVSTASKQKKGKIRPLDQPTQSEGTGGDPVFLETCKTQEELEDRHTKKGPFNVWMTPKYSTIPQGSKLTEERIADQNIGAER